MSQPPKQPNTSRGPTLQQTDLSQEEAPTQRIPRVKMPKPQSSTQADGGQDYRTRVEQAQLPDNVRKAALREVSKLERTSDQSPESGYIRTWLDTVLGLPWTTKAADSTGIQPAHEVDPAAANIEKAAETEADPPAADTEKVAGKNLDPAATGAPKAAQEKVEPAAAGAENVDIAPAGPKDDDTIEIPAVRPVSGRGRHPQKPRKQQAKQEPPAAVSQKAAYKKVESAAAAGAEKVDIAPAGPRDDDTVEMPAVRAVSGRGKFSKQQAKQEPPAGGTQKAAQQKADPPAADTDKVAGKNLDPPAAVTQKTAQEKVESAATATEKAKTAPVGPRDDDTVEIPAVRVVQSGGRPPQNLSKQPGNVEPEATDPQKAVQTKVAPAATGSHTTATGPPVVNGAGHPSPQLPGQQVIGTVPVETPPKKKHFRWLALAATVLAALLIGALLFSASRDGGVTAEPVPTASAASSAASPTVSSPTSEPSDESTDTGGGEPTIQLEDLAGSARAYEPVRIEGVYRGGADTFVRVQRREEGKWVFFPLPTRTDPSGRFTAYVELGPGRHRLRMVDPRTGVKSEPFVLVVKG